MTTPTTAGGAVLPDPEDLEALVVWRGDPNDPYFDRQEFGRAVWSKAWTHAIVTAKLDSREATITAPAQAAIDALRAEVERLTRERDELNDARNAAIELANSRHDALRSALMSNAAPEVDRSAERVETARRNALEEAAKLCEDGWHLLTRHECAAAIRALADPLQGKETPR